MISVTFIEHNGTRHDIEADAGESLMQAAVRHSIPGILAECGGACACATCHCYITSEWSSRIAPPERYEQEMLECVIDPCPQSRLSCQVQLTSELNGLTILIPESQV